MRPVKWQYFQWPWVFCWMYFTYCKSSGSIFRIVAYQLTRFGAWCVTWSLCITGVVVFFTLGYTETLLLVNLGVRSFLSRHILHSRLSDVASWLHISCWCVCVYIIRCWWRCDLASQSMRWTLHRTVDWWRSAAPAPRCYSTSSHDWLSDYAGTYSLLPAKYHFLLVACCYKSLDLSSCMCDHTRWHFIVSLSIPSIFLLFSARCNIYFSRLCYDASVRLSVTQCRINHGAGGAPAPGPLS